MLRQVGWHPVVESDKLCVLVHTYKTSLSLRTTKDYTRISLSPYHRIGYVWLKLQLRITQEGGQYQFQHASLRTIDLITSFN